MPAVRDLAKDFLRPYVEDGWSVEEICAGQHGAGDADSGLQIGGSTRVNGERKEIGHHRLAVTRFEGRDYFGTFSVAELYQEIREEIEDRTRPKQQTLW